MYDAEIYVSDLRWTKPWVVSHTVQGFTPWTDYTYVWQFIRDYDLAGGEAVKMRYLREEARAHWQPKIETLRWQDFNWAPNNYVYAWPADQYVLYQNTQPRVPEEVEDDTG